MSSFFKFSILSTDVTVSSLYIGTFSFIDSFDISFDTDDSYKTKTADIKVSMDMIQAAGDAIVSIWGLGYDSLGITKPSDGENLGDTLVTFISPSSKFDIDAGNVDLFKNFKDLVKKLQQQSNSENKPQENSNTQNNEQSQENSNNQAEEKPQEDSQSQAVNDNSNGNLSAEGSN